jgi:hypothetical protein
MVRAPRVMGQVSNLPNGRSASAPPSATVCERQKRTYQQCSRHTPCAGRAHGVCGLLLPSATLRGDEIFHHAGLRDRGGGQAALDVGQPVRRRLAHIVDQHDAVQARADPTGQGAADVRAIFQTSKINKNYVVVCGQGFQGFRHPGFVRLAARACKRFAHRQHGQTVAKRFDGYFLQWQMPGQGIFPANLRQQAEALSKLRIDQVRIDHDNAQPSLHQSPARGQYQGGHAFAFPTTSQAQDIAALLNHGCEGVGKLVHGAGSLSVKPLAGVGPEEMVHLQIGVPFRNSRFGRLLCPLWLRVLRGSRG